MQNETFLILGVVGFAFAFGVLVVALVHGFSIKGRVRRGGANASVNLSRK